MGVETCIHVNYIWGWTSAILFKKGTVHSFVFTFHLLYWRYSTGLFQWESLGSVAYTEVCPHDTLETRHQFACVFKKKKRINAVSSGLIVSDDLMELEIFLWQSTSRDLWGIFIGAEPSKLTSDKQEN